jgi:hypothetical protein
VAVLRPNAADPGGNGKSPQMAGAEATGKEGFGADSGRSRGRYRATGGDPLSGRSLEAAAVMIV